MLTTEPERSIHMVQVCEKSWLPIRPLQLTEHRLQHTEPPLRSVERALQLSEEWLQSTGRPLQRSEPPLQGAERSLQST